MSPYALFLLLSLITGYIAAALLLKKNRVPGNIIGYSVLLSFIMTLLGARLYGVILTGFKKGLLDSGFASIGAVIGYLLSVFIMTLICPVYKKPLWYSSISSIPLMYGISKLGCHCAGCCHGISYNGFLAVTYNNEYITGGPYFPIQLIESLSFLMIFLVCLYLSFFKKSKYTIQLSIILCSIAKFSLECLREEHIGKILSANQTICIILTIISIYLIVQHKRVG